MNRSLVIWLAVLVLQAIVAIHVYTRQVSIVSLVFWLLSIILARFVL